jgi:Hemerythrin HHE cation binding domain
MTTRDESTSDKADKGDVLAVLKAQHDRIRSMFDEVDRGAGDTRQQRFEALRAFLAVHETAEELIVHPRARWATNGNAVVDDRLREEHDAKVVLSRLDGMSVTDPAFAADFAALREAVLSHADHEEREEFPLVVASTDAGTRALMATALLAAEAMGPTHPHPGVESMTANLVAGPMASLIDRTRDAVRAVLGPQS